MRAPIHSVKHYIQQSLATVTGGALVNFTIAKARPTASIINAEDIVEGSVVKAVFVEMWVRSSEISPGTILVSLVKIPGIGAITTFADIVALNNYDNKKNVLYHTQGLTNDADANAVPFLRQWFKIPKGKQRFGLDDRLVLAVASQAAIDNVICGFATYKEYA